MSISVVETAKKPTVDPRLDFPLASDAFVRAPQIERASRRQGVASCESLGLIQKIFWTVVLLQVERVLEIGFAIGFLPPHEVTLGALVFPSFDSSLCAFGGFFSPNLLHRQSTGAGVRQQKWMLGGVRATPIPVVHGAVSGHVLAAPNFGKRAVAHHHHEMIVIGL
ncbi:MAG: hypothetical protein HKL99_11275 [Burkholderiales bacterium]|nr:hypothetical protein [Burkholderiales bacterium]